MTQPSSLPDVPPSTADTAIADARTRLTTMISEAYLRLEAECVRGTKEWDRQYEDIGNMELELDTLDIDPIPFLQALGLYPKDAEGEEA